MQPTRHPDRFVDRHIGPDSRDVEEMLAALGVRNLDELIDRTVPASIRMQKALDLPPGRSEFGLLRELAEIAAKNQVFRSYIGMGYSDTVTPPVIQRNILENAGWYTQYTPYQPEISQGRLEALLNYQTMVEDLTALPVANASLLDEATAAAEAMTMFHNVAANAGNAFFVAQDCHPQTIEVVRTRAAPFGIEVIVGDPASFDPARQKVFGALLQYPATDGAVRDPRKFIERAHAQGALVVVAADILALTLLTPPGELGADCAVGSTQRFGVPLGYGGPHAAYFATKNEYVRHMPGRIIGVSIDAQGHRALRMALQTREQHIRREKATSNICTAQALLAIIAGMYAVYHGPRGVHAIARHVHGLTAQLARGLAQLGFRLRHEEFFDTIAVQVERADAVLAATAEMLPITWPAFSRLHPFAPREQAAGYTQIFDELSQMLSEITGFPGVSLQPNSGAQGEYAGLQVIKAFHASRGEGHRNVCLIPQSAHGTNPASAAMVNYRIVVIKTDESGNVDVKDLEAKAAEHSKDLAALMITYPSTHGVFEEEIRRICDVVHQHGGQVYMDGANMNAQVGLCRPGDFGPDVCHLNLHKTFCIPHGGGGPGMGPICAAKHLVPSLPGHPLVKVGGEKPIGPVSAAPWGSASILVISWAYIRMMGAAGLTQATKVAILNANYVAKRLDEHFPVLYKGKNGFVAHECIVDLRKVKRDAGIEVDDVAKRLMDYGFHAPTTSFPVIGTLMIEPTESEPKAELDRVW